MVRSKVSDSAKERLESARDRLATLHAAGLFIDLAASEIEATVPRRYRTRDVLVHAAYHHIKNFPAPYALRALENIPAGLGLERVLVRTTRRHVQIISGAYAGIFEPNGPIRAPYEWERLVDVALGELGDGRRVVPLELLGDDDGMCIVATGEQSHALAETRLINARLVEVLRDLPLPRVELGALLRAAVDDLASRLSKSVARSGTSAVELELSPDAVTELVDAVYNERYRAITRAARATRKQAARNRP